MMDLNQLTFTLPEILSFMGVAQCIFVLVYMVFRSGNFLRAFVPFLYFLILACAFLFDAAQRLWAPLLEHYYLYNWFFWLAGPPMSAILIIQIARITKIPSFKNFAVLMLIPAAYIAAISLSFSLNDCVDLLGCQPREDWLALAGFVAGCFSLLSVWLQKNMLDDLQAQKNGPERFWLILALVISNTIFLLVIALYVNAVLELADMVVIRTILGISFVYIASTSLFRIYPQAVRVEESEPEKSLNDFELEKAIQIEKLMFFEKVYQEPSYNRSDLAKELNISEASLSKIVKFYFDKTVPHLLNEYRVRDAERLLKETQAPVSVIAQDVGFNSIATFNRVFKDMVGVSPSMYRQGN